MSTLALLGGTPVRRLPFPNRVTMGDQEKQAVAQVMESDVLSAFLGGPGPFFNGGNQVLEFEREWAQAFGVPHAISVNSWTSGLMAAVGAIGIEPGDEVITTPFTMSATATCSLFYGGIPVFADIDPATFCLDPASVEARVTPRTRAIIVVHLFGRPADMDPLLAIARRHGLKVIEDAAQAPGAHYRGRPVGALGDLGGFSLNYHKHIHTGEGGVLVTQDPELARRCQLIRNHGENLLEDCPPEDLVNLVGANYRLTELQAAIGRVQIGRLPGHLETRRRLADRLTDRLKQLPGIQLEAPLEPGSTHAHYVFPFRFKASQAGIPRSLFVRAVNAELPHPTHFEQVPLTEGYVRPLYLNPLFQHRRAFGKQGHPFNQPTQGGPDYRPGICPVTERLYREELVLTPLVREPLTPEAIDDLADAIEKVLTHTEVLATFHQDGDHVVLTPLEASNRTLED